MQSAALPDAKAFWQGGSVARRDFLRPGAFGLILGPEMPFKAYILCTSPRSGSTLLCRMLQETGLAGAPDSHFHAPSFEAWLGYYRLSDTVFSTRQAALDAIFRAARSRGKGASDIFGLRMQRPSSTYFSEQLVVLHPEQPDDHSRIEAAFGETLYIHLTREAKLDQAISYVKAAQSGLWHKAADGSELERLSAPQASVYDAEAIGAQLAVFEQMDDAWEAWFAAQNITPLRVTYAALSDDPYGTLGRVLAALGLDWAPAPNSTPPVAKLADATNAEWAARFRAERSKITRPI